MLKYASPLTAAFSKKNGPYKHFLKKQRTGLPYGNLANAHKLNVGSQYNIQYACVMFGNFDTYNTWKVAS